MTKFPWYNTIRFRLALALLTLFSLLAGTAGFTLYEVDLRKHDYEILNLAGQMRVISHALEQQSRNYLEAAAMQPGESRHEPGYYYRDLQQNTQLYDKIISAFRNRKLDPELTGHADPLVCNWDRNSRNQLDVTATEWQTFYGGLRLALGLNPAQPDLAAAAAFVARHSEALVKSSDDLTHAFQHMMEGKLATIHRFNQAALALAALMTLLIVVQVQRKILAPLDLTMAGFSRVANGDFGYQVPLAVENEIGRMTHAFNHLSSQLRGVFRLTGRISRGTNLHQAMKFVCEEFRAFLPVEWVGVLLLTPDRKQLALERLYGETPGTLQENEFFHFSLGLPQGALDGGKAHAVDNLAALATGQKPESFIARLNRDGKQSAVFLPLSHANGGEAVLVFASSTLNAYTTAHVEFLTNLAAQIAHILEKTLFMEGLVVAAVEGLAKLAESRDPETGDHLVRMSLYSAILAEELGKSGPYRDQVTPAYIRDVFRFAPMHDIGKVGISDDILLKPGRLDPAERTEMERHPVIGGQVLRRSESQMEALGYSIFGVGIEIAESHHEKFDGSGYPGGLQGEAIPLSARIIAVADVFDALTSKRPYKEAWPVEKTLQTMESDSGKHFDPVIIEAMKNAMPRIMDVYQRLKHV